ncbi:hypothetical protein VTH82DRAFT_7174 [Thermothelomyces myriococcoides]
MRHLDRSHPRKPAKSKLSPKATQPRVVPQPPIDAIPSQPQSCSQSQSQFRIHPFALLSYKQQVAFAGHVLFALFSVGMKQLEEENEKERQQGQLQNHGVKVLQGGGGRRLQAALTSINITPSSTSATPYVNSNCTPHQAYCGRLDDGPESEDTDDEDGGAALCGSPYGDWTTRFGDKGDVAFEDSKGACELDNIDSLDLD